MVLHRISAWYHTSTHFGDQRLDNTGVSLASPLSTGIPLDHTGDYRHLWRCSMQWLHRVPGKC